VYLTGFKEEHKLSPATMLMDVVTNFGTYNGKAYIPKNYSGKTYGPLSIRQTLAGSLNIPAVKVLALVGVDAATQTAKDMGITSPLQDCGLSLVLGGCEVRLLDHTNGYATIANNGIYNPATGILKIESRDGTMLDEYQNKSKRVVDEQANYELISILTDNNARSYIFGVNNNLYYPERQVACKTGTTNDFRDGWTMCATPQLAVGVWAGNNRGTMKAGADGSKIAAPITRAFIKAALKDTPAEDFIVPSKIKSGAAVEFGLGPNPAEMAADDPLHGRETHAGSVEFGGRMQPLKWRKQFVHIRHVEASAVVPHEIRERAVRFPALTEFDLRCISFRGELPRIRK
jgi:membrane peptidoglycan carboxypeptidase